MTRPNWDEYFLAFAKTASLRADCSRRQVGAVIVKRNRIVATGYNGAPAGEPGCLDGNCPRGRLHFPKRDLAGVEYCVCGEYDWPCPNDIEPGSSYDTGPGFCIAVHAEANALLYADRDKCEGSTIYITDEPCQGCARLIIGAGISRVVTPVDIYITG